MGIDKLSVKRERICFIAFRFTPLCNSFIAGAAVEEGHDKLSISKTMKHPLCQSGVSLFACALKFCFGIRIKN